MDNNISALPVVAFKASKLRKQVLFALRPSKTQIENGAIEVKDEAGNRLCFNCQAFPQVAEKLLAQAGPTGKLIVYIGETRPSADLTNPGLELTTKNQRRKFIGERAVYLKTNGELRRLFKNSRCEKVWVTLADQSKRIEISKASLPWLNLEELKPVPLPATPYQIVRLVIAVRRIMHLEYQDLA